MYFCYLLKLYKPWRTEADLILPGCIYEETYMELKLSFPDMVLYHERNQIGLHTQRQFEEKVKKIVQELMDEDKNENKINEHSESCETVTDGCVVDTLKNNMNDILEAHAKSVKNTDKQDLQNNYQALNTSQKNHRQRCRTHLQKQW